MYVCRPVYICMRVRMCVYVTVAHEGNKSCPAGIQAQFGCFVVIDPQSRCDMMAFRVCCDSEDIGLQSRQGSISPARPFP